MLRVGEVAHQLGLRRLGVLFAEAGGDPADVEQRRLGLADIAGQGPVAYGETRLALQGLQLLLDLSDDVVDALEVLLCCPETQLSLVAA